MWSYRRVVWECTYLSMYVVIVVFYLTYTYMVCVCWVIFIGETFHKSSQYFCGLEFHGPDTQINIMNDERQTKFAQKFDISMSDHV